MNLRRDLISPNIFRATSFALALTLIGAAGCKKSDAPETTPAASTAPADDNSIASSVQSKIGSDGALANEAIQVDVQGGVVTLNGTVSSQAAKVLASNDAASVAGAKTVINNLSVQEQTAGPVPAPTAAAASRPVKVVKPAPVPIERPAPAPAPAVQAPPARAAAPISPPPPPAPTTRTVTIPAGTYLPVRLTQGLDSATTQTGDSFTGVISSDVTVDGWVALRQGTPVSGRVVEAKDAAHFKGSSLLSIELTGISRRGERIAISTEPYSKEGSGRGKNTATKAGVGAAAGAILGGIFGGGKGAAIGAAAGGGAGVGVNAITKGQQVQIPSESLLRFRLTNSISVVASQSSSDSNGGLQTR